MPEVAIKAQGLTKWFGEGAARTLAVRDVSFEAYFGEILFVVGPSGSGKTTMLSMISEILRPNEGSVHYRRNQYLEFVRRRDCRASTAQNSDLCSRITISSLG